ncbi:MAG: T9SS type A sorting domain-containing protein, partial [Candidatus Cloacimonadaceae bacterium]
LSESGTYFYWLEALDLDGQMQMFGAVSVTITSQPDGPVVPPVIETALLQIFPNPFNPMLFIKANHKSDGILSVSIYDLMGRKIITLQDEYSTKGLKNLSWNGKDAAGRDCASGIYIVKCRSGNEIKATKAILLK